MRQMAIVAEEKINELLSILDKDIGHIHCTLSRLNELRGLVIKRDEGALAELLESIRIEAEDYSSNESERQSVCNSLARLLGCSLEQMTLSRLIDALPADVGELVNERRMNLCELIEELKKELRQQYTFQDIVSKNHAIQEIFQILPDIAESDSTVLLQGPSGSGKELFAKAIHNLSLRKDKPFIKVNCGALPDNLLESELFGYVKGAFTDAKKDKPGRFALANGGTIFLDEIGDMSPALQVKLLRVLQDREYERLGGTSTVKVDVRVVAATNKDLVTLVRSRQFRDDLYYRLNVVKVDLPPLLRRREDISLLVEHFVEKFNLKSGKNLSGVSHEVMTFLMRYDFPGNVRELENIIEHAFVMCKGDMIELRHLPPELVDWSKEAPLEENVADGPLQRAEAESIRKALERNRGNRLRTARELGIDRSTLWRKIKRYGIVV